MARCFVARCFGVRFLGVRFLGVRFLGVRFLGVRFLGVLALGLLGCSDDPVGVRGTDEVCRWTNRPAPDALRAVEVGEYDADGLFVPYGDGDTARRVRGFQGFEMILPVVRVPAVPADPAELCVLLRIDPSERGRMLERDGDHLLTGSIDYPIDRGEVTLTVAITAETFRTEPLTVTVNVP